LNCFWLGMLIPLRIVWSSRHSLVKQEVEQEVN
jgi:hypothetical protein